MAFLPNVPPPEAPSEVETGQGLGLLLKSLLQQIPQTPIDPTPLAYSASAPSFISKLAQMEGAPLKMFLPEMYEGVKDYFKAGLSRLNRRQDPSMIDKLGNAWKSEMSHTDTMMRLINSKNDDAFDMPMRQWLFDHEYDLPQWLGDSQNIRSAGNIGMGHNLQAPLNATEDALRGAGELVPKNTWATIEYTMPNRGFPGDTPIPFKRSLPPDYENWRTYKKFDMPTFVRDTQEKSQMVQDLFKTWIKNNPNPPQIPLFSMPKWVEKKDKIDKAMKAYGKNP